MKQHNHKRRAIRTVLLPACLIILLVFGGCLQFSVNTEPSSNTSDNYGYSQADSAASAVDPGSTAYGGDTAATDYAVPQTEPVTELSQVVASLSQADVVTLLSEAVNLTKSYTGQVSVSHTERFTAEIKSITGGDLVARVANRLIGAVVKPTDETLNFSNGTATNSEGETVPLLLPKRGLFTLTADGVTSATASVDGQNIVVDVTLVTENVGMNDVPAANAAGIGYLDAGSIDISILTVKSVDICYQGSKIHAVINPDGYIVSAVYSIPMEIDGTATALGITGSAVFAGEETEEWSVHW